MKLSAEQFENVVAALGSKNTPRPKERRLMPRVGLSGVLKVFTIRDATLQPCVEMRLRDVSAGGVGLIYEFPLSPGTQFIARFSPDADRGEELILICQVANCHRLSPHLYGIGATFKKQLRSRNPAPAKGAHAAPPKIWPATPDKLTPDDQAKIQAAILS